MEGNWKGNGREKERKLMGKGKKMEGKRKRKEGRLEMENNKNKAT